MRRRHWKASDKGFHLEQKLIRDIRELAEVVAEYTHHYDESRDWRTHVYDNFVHVRRAIDADDWITAKQRFDSLWNQWRREDYIGNETIRENVATFRMLLTALARIEHFGVDYDDY